MATGLPMAGAWCMREQRKEGKKKMQFLLLSISTSPLSSSFRQSASPGERLTCGFPAALSSCRGYWREKFW